MCAKIFSLILRPPWSWLSWPKRVKDHFVCFSQGYSLTKFNLRCSSRSRSLSTFFLFFVIFSSPWQFFRLQIKVVFFTLPNSTESFFFSFASGVQTLIFFVILDLKSQYIYSFLFFCLFYSKINIILSLLNLGYSKVGRFRSVWNNNGSRSFMDCNWNVYLIEVRIRNQLWYRCKSLEYVWKKICNKDHDWFLSSLRACI